MMKFTKIFYIICISLICSITPVSAWEMGSIENTNPQMPQKTGVEYTGNVYQNTQTVGKINKTPGNNSNIINNTNDTVPDKPSFFTTKNIIITAIIITAILALVWFCHSYYAAKKAAIQALTLTEAGPLESAAMRGSRILEDALSKSAEVEEALGSESAARNILNIKSKVVGELKQAELNSFNLREATKGLDKVAMKSKELEEAIAAVEKEATDLREAIKLTRSDLVRININEPEVLTDIKELKRVLAKKVGELKELGLKSRAFRGKVVNEIIPKVGESLTLRGTAII